jgi:hypothetical protein
MAFGIQKHQQMDEKTAAIIANLDHSLDSFDASGPTQGPKNQDVLNAYLSALALRRSLGLEAALQNEEFSKASFRMLEAWGMNRRRAKLVEPRILHDSLASNGPALLRFEGVRLDSVHESRAAIIASELWPGLASLKVGIQETKIVANSKMGHLLLPDLVPPIDNEHTLRFFEILSFPCNQEPEAFREILVRFARIASASGPSIGRRVDREWHTTFPKIIDNAIEGFLRSRK